MIEEKVIKESLQNLYDLIDNYYNNYLEKNKSKNLQEYKLYQTSIYRNISEKLIPFTQIFDLKNENPYILTDFETEVLRNYIGIYNNGKKQTKKEISKIFKVSPQTIDRTLKRIIRDFMAPSYQQQFLDERNELIKQSITNKNKNKILELDISFLNITENLEEILRLENINTINDILNIDIEQIEKININHGYYSHLKIFPKSIINEIHSIGLNFKREKLLKKTNDELKKLEIQIEEVLSIEPKTQKLKTVADILLAQQFEPELLNIYSIEEILEINWLLCNSKLEEAYKNFILSQVIIKKDNRVVKDNRGLVKRNFPYMDGYEIDEIMDDTESLFDIYNKNRYM